MSEIDRIKERYERRKQLNSELYSYFNPGNLFIIHQRERQLLELLDKHGMNPLSDKRILDVGCGSGLWLREFIKYGASVGNLYGIDLLGERVAKAKLLSPNLNIIKGNAEILDFAPGSFDI
ncbi:MAG: class I SAM-dependent methyltransferase, partial [Actinomycetota bacterium]|nr:class I SAM-dependent methyltransferase [Actinomycetota bacterium]